MRTRKRRRIVKGLLALALITVALFVINGLILAAGETPVSGVESTDIAVSPSDDGHIKIMAWNLAKGFVYTGGTRFASKEELIARLERMSDLIRKEQPDLLFLSEVVVECTPADVDQIRFLAQHTGLPHWIFGENYNFGLPFFRIVGGNAILAKYPLQPVGNPDLAGRQPFYITKNNRRVLLASTTIGNQTLTLASLHTDSFHLDNNLQQTRQILQLVPPGKAILAGDFNAQPHNASIAEVVGSGHFTGSAAGPKTYPSDNPQRRLDYIFVPSNWRLIKQRIINDQLSDHRPVIATFRVAP